MKLHPLHGRLLSCACFIFSIALHAQGPEQANTKSLADVTGSVESVIQKSRHYAASGRRSLAEEVVRTALRKNPGNSELRLRLAELAIGGGEVSEALHALQALQREKLSDRDAQQVRDLLALIGFEQRSSYPTSTRYSQTESEAEIPTSESARVHALLNGAVAPPDPDREYFVDAAQSITAWRASTSREHDRSRVLADIRVDHLQDDYRVTQHLQRIVALATVADAAAYSTESIRYIPESQDLTILHARIHHKDGRVEQANDLGDVSTADLSVGAYSDARLRQLQFPGLHSGDAIELEYTLTALGGTQNPGFYAELVAFGGTLDCDLQRYVLRSPAALDIHYGVKDVPAAREERTGSERVALWEKRNVTALVREARSPSWSEQGAYVEASTFPSWDSLGRWYAALVTPQLQLSPELQAIVQDIARLHGNDVDRVQAIYDFVLNKTRYVALEFGIYGLKPYPVAETYARRFGDCKDKAALLIAMLRAANIDAEMALVRTRKLGEIVLSTASPSIFDHAIVYVPKLSLWLDGTAEFSRLRELPADDQGIQALTIAEDGSSLLRRTPVSSADDNYSRRTISARVNQDGSIGFSGATYMRGVDASELRREEASPASREKYVREGLSRVFPAVELREVHTAAKVDNPLEFSGTFANFAGQKHLSLPSSWMQRNYGSGLAPTSTRTQAIELDVPWTTDEEIRIHLPLDAKLSRPSDLTLSSPFGDAEIRYTSSQGELTIESKVRITRTSIAAAEYAEFRRFCRALDAAFRQGIELDIP